MKGPWKDKRLIPAGYYCYSEKGNCPYWSTRRGKPKMANGYCTFLEIGDWNINAKRVYSVNEKVNGKWKPTKLGTANELGVVGGLLWDQVKECGLKERITKTGPSSLARTITKEKK